MLLFRPPCSEAYNSRLSFRSKSKEQLNERRAGLSRLGVIGLTLTAVLSQVPERTFLECFFFFYRCYLLMTLGVGKSAKIAQKTDHSITICSNFFCIGMVYIAIHILNPHVQKAQNMFGKGGYRVFKAELRTAKIGPLF